MPRARVRLGAGADNSAIAPVATRGGRQACSRLRPNACSTTPERATAWQLAERFAPELDTAGVASLYRDLELPLVPILAGLERAGVKVDTQALASQAAHMEQEMGTLAAEIYKQAGETFNIGSPKQLGEILFDKLQLPVLKRTARPARRPRPSRCSKSSLTHDLPRLILDWRSLSKQAPTSTLLPRSCTRSPGACTPYSIRPSPPPDA
jgi:DNA polymerase I-like protein with 3'-5' exonuclease and polymerase domains